MESLHLPHAKLLYMIAILAKTSQLSRDDKLYLKGRLKSNLIEMVFMSNPIIMSLISEFVNEKSLKLALLDIASKHKEFEHPECNALRCYFNTGLSIPLPPRRPKRKASINRDGGNYWNGNKTTLTSKNTERSSDEQSVINGNWL